MLGACGLPEGCLLSVRVGSTRRQAPAKVDKFRLYFPKKGSLPTSVKVDLLVPFGGGNLELQQGQEQYPLELRSGSGSPPVQLTLGVRKGVVDHATGSAVSGFPLSTMGIPSEGGMSPSKRHIDALEARKYMDEHNLLGWVQELLEMLIRDRPSDPWDHIDKHTDHARQQRKYDAHKPATTSYPDASKLAKRNNCDERPVESQQSPPAGEPVITQTADTNIASIRSHARTIFTSAGMDGRLHRQVELMRNIEMQPESETSLNVSSLGSLSLSFSHPLDLHPSPAKSKTKSCLEDQDATCQVNLAPSEPQTSSAALPGSASQQPSGNEISNTAMPAMAAMSPITRLAPQDEQQDESATDSGTACKPEFPSTAHCAQSELHDGRTLDLGVECASVVDQSKQNGSLVLPQEMLQEEQARECKPAATSSKPDVTLNREDARGIKEEQHPKMLPFEEKWEKSVEFGTNEEVSPVSKVSPAFQTSSQVFPTLPNDSSSQADASDNRAIVTHQETLGDVGDAQPKGGKDADTDTTNTRNLTDLKAEEAGTLAIHAAISSACDEVPADVFEEVAVDAEQNDVKPLCEAMLTENKEKALAKAFHSSLKVGDNETAESYPCQAAQIEGEEPTGSISQPHQESNRPNNTGTVGVEAAVHYDLVEAVRAPDEPCDLVNFTDTHQSTGNYTASDVLLRDTEACQCFGNDLKASPLATGKAREMHSANGTEQHPLVQPSSDGDHMEKIRSNVQLMMEEASSDGRLVRCLTEKLKVQPMDPEEAAVANGAVPDTGELSSAQSASLGEASRSPPARTAKEDETAPFNGPADLLEKLKAVDAVCQQLELAAAAHHSEIVSLVPQTTSPSKTPAESATQQPASTGAPSAKSQSASAEVMVTHAATPPQDEQVGAKTTEEQQYALQEDPPVHTTT